MNHAKNILIFTFCLAFGCLRAQYSGTSLSEAGRTKKATLICIYSETPGYITSGEKFPVGVLPQLMSSFADYEKKIKGIDILFDYQPFKKDAPIAEIFEKVTSSKDGVFGLVFVFITPDRKKTLNLSASIFESPSFLLTSNKAPEINSLEDAAQKLKGYTAYVNKGNFFEDRLRELKAKTLPDLKIEYFQSYNVTNISETVAKDKAMLYVDISGLQYATKNRLPIKNHKVLNLSTPMGIFFSKQSSWDDEFNKFLHSGFLKSNEFKKIIADNLGYRTFNLLKLEE